MTTRSSNTSPKAFTLIELLVVIAIIALLAALLLTTRSDPPRTIPDCMSNQKQIAIGMIMFVDDNAGKFPRQLSVTNRGTMEDTLLGSAVSSFKALSGYLMQARLLVCPSDKTRRVAADFAAFSNTNLSYFANLDAITNSQLSILAGDRHLQVNGQPVKSGLQLLATNLTVTWTRELHPRTTSPTGVLAFTDGHAQALREKLSACFQMQTLATNRLVMP